VNLRLAASLRSTRLPGPRKAAVIATLPSAQPLQYLLLMAGCLLITLPLEFVLGARVYRRFGVALLALLPVVLLFSVWDIAGILRGHWTYNPRYVTGIQLVLGMPLEELVFFLVIPWCGLLTYEAVGSVLRLLRRWRPEPVRSGPDTGRGTGSTGA
jgi:lycopene beta-cyclase